ncbi:DUF1259 domain-containing protein [Bacillus sp. 1P02SD]|uniref:DUF1259 domain-containing protein n=1 Tax=Bacillus sp. 1P02SD TaxID=3132264 RepID=UPI0039A3C2A5
MKTIIPIFVLCLSLWYPVDTTYGAGDSECRLFENLFADHVKQTSKICKVEVSRKDLNVTLEGVKVSPEMAGLSLNADFERNGNTTIVLGEFALLPQEVNPVIDALRKGDIQISALHNHWFEQPMVLYLHFQGKGNPETLAQTVKSAIDVVQQK